jgi:tRNA nucleotidyltransferase/poly(A) polymerase
MAMVPDHGVWADGRAVVSVLRTAGHEAWIAGGAVRDLLLGRDCDEIDVATAAPPEEVERLFPRTVAVGKAFGVVVVVLGEGRQVEVATFRTDGLYVDGRRPTGVRFATAMEDVQRRDLTVNALLLDPATGAVADHVGGRADLAARVVRAVGDASARFGEDRLRVLRALRFAAVLGFPIEDSTWRAVCDRDLAGVSRERILAELLKALDSGAGGAFCRLCARAGRLDGITPGLDAEATASLLDRLGCVPREVALAAWLRPLGAARARGWLQQQPVPTVWRRDVPWLLAGAEALGGTARGEHLRLQLDPRAAALSILCHGIGGDIAIACNDAAAQAASRGRCPLGAVELLDAGLTEGPELGRALRAMEEAWLTGCASTRQELLHHARQAAGERTMR